MIGNSKKTCKAGSDKLLLLGVGRGVGERVGSGLGPTCHGNSMSLIYLKSDFKYNAYSSLGLELDLAW